MCRLVKVIDKPFVYGMGKKWDCHATLAMTQITTVLRAVIPRKGENRLDAGISSIMIPNENPLKE